MCRKPETGDFSGRPAVVVQPQPTTPQAVNIAECSVTTDSVVATARVRTDATMRRVVVQWGDGTVNTLRSRPGTEAAVGQPQLPAGTYKLSHAYAAPESGEPFVHFVLIRVEDASGGIDFCIRKITLTPRYRVTNYRTMLSLGSKCDSWFESRSEFDITLYVDQQVARTWRWEPEESSSVTGTILLDEIPVMLEGSLVSRELTVADGTVPVRLEIIERDPLVDEVLPHIRQDLRAPGGGGTMQGAVTESASGCSVNFRYDREVTLIVPLPSFGQTVVASV